MMKSEMPACSCEVPETFLYFAYGDNLCSFRIHMNNPTADFVSIARADVNQNYYEAVTENYRLDFIKYSKFWGGPTATLVPTANAHVWGCIWRLHTDDKITLDEQKEVERKRYFFKQINVLTPYMGQFNCRVYIQKVIPLPRGDNDEIPVERWPSWAYKQIMITGAREHGLPEYYIEHLTKIKHNGEEGCIRMLCLLIRYGRDEPCVCPVPGRILREPLKLDMKEFKYKKDHADAEELKAIKARKFRGAI